MSELDLLILDPKKMCDNIKEDLLKYSFISINFSLNSFLYIVTRINHDLVRYEK